MPYRHCEDPRAGLTLNLIGGGAIPSLYDTPWRFAPPLLERGMNPKMLLISRNADIFVLACILIVG